MDLPAFYPILDTELLARSGMPPAAAAGAVLEGGARILQFRHKAFFSRETFALAAEVAGLCRQAGALFVLNDRADFAALLGAALHLGQEDLSPAEARRMLPHGAVVGFSTHTARQLEDAAAQPADYVAIGPIFDTASKANPDPAIGLEGLRQLRPLTSRPLVAIGGITRQTARRVLQAGADSVAVIGDLCAERSTPELLRMRTEEWLQLLKT